MNQASDRCVFGKFIVSGHGLLCLEHVRGNASLFQPFERFGFNFESLMYAP